jgi:nicotinate dehydrogenase subunit B
MSEPLSRKTLLRRAGVIGVVAPRKGATADAAPEDGLDLHVCLTAEGRILAFSGHVDLGTGIRTALAQMVAEELDFPFEAVEMVLGDTADTPDQGATIASETIQVTSLAIRIAATQIRARLISLAAAALSCAEDEIAVSDGVISRKGEMAPAIALDTLLANERILLPLAGSAEFKQVDQYKFVGRSVARVDIPAKVTGSFTYVHDVRVPGMLHGRVVRPPYAGMDAGDFVGRSLISVDRDSIADVPGIRAVVVEGDFIGIVAEREEWAAEAALKLRTQWREFTAPDLSDLGQALRAHPSTPRLLAEEGDVDTALENLETRLDRTYVWPYHMHGSIGPSCAVADVRADGITVWTGSQNPYPLQHDLAVLTSLPKERIDVIRFEGRRLLWPQLCRRRRRRRGAALACGRRAGASPAHPRAGASLGAERCCPADRHQGWARAGRLAESLRLPHLVPVQCRADPGAAADRAPPEPASDAPDGRSHGGALIQLREHAADSL